jgi:GTP-binding protein Era
VLAADEQIGAGDRFVARRAFAAGVPVVIALNKVDRVKPDGIARQIAQAAALGEFHALHPVSARTGDGVAALRDDLVALLGEGPPYFETGTVTDLPLELRIAELIREQVLARTREEVPHAVTVEVDEVTDRRVTASVLVETRSQKQIVIGKGGSMIKEIGTDARAELEALLGRPIFLDLRVRVREKWRRDVHLLERLGL